MNEEINNKDYKPLTPFKGWVLENFPFIEADFDAITNYELICKITEYLNNVIYNQNEVQELSEELVQGYNALIDYVNNYFLNLNVQDEINKKLDEMVLDGSLTNLIKSYIDPLINAQNVRIGLIDSKVDAAVSGTPLAVSSVDDMTDTNRIYVNTSNGYWYYYDNEWLQGGVYQSTSLSNKSVHFPNFDDVLQDSFKTVNDLTDIYQVNTGLVNANGTITTNGIGQLGYYEFSVTPFDIYRLRMFVSGFTDNLVCIQYLDDTTVVANILTSALDVVNNYYDTVITIPTGVNKIRVQTQRYETRLNVGNIIEKVSNIKIDNIKKEQLDSKLQSFFKDDYEAVTPTTFIQNALLGTANNNPLVSYDNSDLLSIDVNAGEKYLITIKQIVANPIVYFTTKNKISTIEVDSNSYNVQNWFDYIKSNTNNDNFVNYSFVIPDGCNKIYINKAHNDSTFSLSKSIGYKINESEITQKVNNVGFSKLIAIGDSITEVNFRALKNYLAWIKDDIPSLTIQNLGASGTGYYNPGNNDNRFVNRVSSIVNYDLTDEVILVMGSINDVPSVPDHLGSLGDTTNSTIYGAIYNFYNTLFTSLNGARVGCISPINRKGSQNNDSFLSYVKAIEDTCKLFNVPFLDIHDITNLRPDDSTFLNIYYVADGIGNESELDTSGIHPNSAGHHLFYGRVKDFINRL